MAPWVEEARSLKKHGVLNTRCQDLSFAAAYYLKDRAWRGIFKGTLECTEFHGFRTLGKAGCHSRSRVTNATLSPDPFYQKAHPSNCWPCMRCPSPRRGVYAYSSMISSAVSWSASSRDRSRDTCSCWTSRRCCFSRRSSRTSRTPPRSDASASRTLSSASASIDHCTALISVADPNYGFSHEASGYPAIHPPSLPRAPPLHSISASSSAKRTTRMPMEVVDSFRDSARGRELATRKQ